MALLAAGVVDALAGTGAPARTARVPLAAPTAYDAAPAGWAVLELLPGFDGPVEELALYFNNLTCAYQLDHRRPLLNVCLGTTLREGPRWEVGTWLMDAALTGPGPEVAQRLAALGVGAVAWHPGLFPGGVREELGRGLEVALGAPAAETTDGGERVLLFAVPGAAGDPPPQAARRDALGVIEAGG